MPLRSRFALPTEHLDGIHLSRALEDVSLHGEVDLTRADGALLHVFARQRRFAVADPHGAVRERDAHHDLRAGLRSALDQRQRGRRDRLREQLHVQRLHGEQAVFFLVDHVKQRRRVELSRILFSGAETLLLDEPTNHLDADSVNWLREYLIKYSGGLVVISHDVNLIETVVNKVFYLDANRNVIDVYNMGWKKYLIQREQDEHRRKVDRATAEKKAAILEKQAEKMRAKASKAKAAQGMFRRAEKLLSDLEEVRKTDKVAKLRFPTPSPCGKTPLSATALSKSYGSLEVFTDVDLAVDKGSRVVILGTNGAGKTTLLRMLAGELEPDTGEVISGHGLRIGYYAQEHESLDYERTVLENMHSSSPNIREPEARNVLGSFLFSGDDVHKKVKVLSGGERTRLALAVLVVSAANVLLLDEPTNNLDPASRHEILGALGEYQGSVILVSHDEGAVRALRPDRVLLLPDGDEDLWNESYLDLVEID